MSPEVSRLLTAKMTKVIQNPAG
ncbi:MAG: hypothetical protein K0Q73_8295, partial [Paenibacillus sp.]|nr:hypothetical protein [Paenibacillus sp.]